MFSDVDKGDIDVLSVDIEGAEWTVLSNMVSRPKVISLELESGLYRNPSYQKIQDWLAQNNYTLWYIEGADSVFVKKGEIQLSAGEKAFLALKNKWLKNKRALRRNRKRLQRKISGK